LPSNRPLNIAHRGSSGMRPEHTVAAYQLAVDQGADIIECDLAVTKDKQLICTHDAWLNKTTDVHTKPEFQDRVKRYRIDGRFIEDYFTVDFTMEELKTLRTVQSRSYRDQSYNYQFPMASFDDYIAVVKNASAFGRTIGIYPETKNPSFFNGILEAENTTMEDILLASLEKYGYVNANSPCFIQSFDENSLRYMANKTELPLIILNPLLLTDQKMTELAVFCYGIGPSKSEILPVNPTSNKLLQSTDFITRAHAKGFKIHPYTFRNEDQFLAFDYGSDPYEEYQTFVNLGVDGLFTDFPHSFSKFLDCQYPQVVGNAAKLSKINFSMRLKDSKW
uniref:glycerophosphodiester phosphodiesterase n=1 Tax=Ciona savignyi TaxID=51511 RepID=H2YK22_CIOSA